MRIGHDWLVSESFSEIPELPSGKILRLELLSNWGDDTFVGLNAVEIFKDDGKRPEVAKVRSTCLVNYLIT